MQKFTSAALAATLALGLLAGSTGVSLADRDDNGKHADKNCVNPAGHVRGHCKHNDNDNDNDRGHHHRGYSYVNGVVQSINASGTAAVRLSNGSIVYVRGAGLSLGQTITLRGSYNGNGQFVVQGNPYSAYGGPYTTTSITGTIISINGNAVQVIHGLSVYTINDAGASINGNLYVGRGITAYGSWSGSTFNATRIS